MTDLTHSGGADTRTDLLTLAAVWSFVAAFLWTVGLVAAALFAYPFSPGYEAATLTIGDAFGMVFGTIALLGCLGVSVASGIGLLKERTWGRAAGIANAVLSLFLVPVGTVAGVLILIYLLKPEMSARFALGS